MYSATSSIQIGNVGNGQISASLNLHKIHIEKMPPFIPVLLHHLGRNKLEMNQVIKS